MYYINEYADNGYKTLIRTYGPFKTKKQAKDFTEIYNMDPTLYEIVIQ